MSRLRRLNVGREFGVMRAFRFIPKARLRPLAVVILISLVSFVILQHQQRTPASAITFGPLVQVDEDHYVNIPYFTESEGMSSTLTLNNNLPHATTATVTIFNDEGRPLALPPITLQSHSPTRFSLKELTQDAGKSFESGNIQIFYRGPSMAVTSQVSVLSVSGRISFESMESEAARYSSSRLDAIVWVTDLDMRAEVALTNAASDELSVLLTSEGEQEKRGKTVTIGARQTRVVDLTGLITNRTKASDAEMVSIVHDGVPGSLIATGFALNEKTGFSCDLPFVDRSTYKSLRLAGASLRVGPAEAKEGLPSGTTFRAPLLIANAGSVPTQAHISVDYTIESVAHRVDLGTVQLAAGKVKQIELWQQLKRRGIEGRFENAGVDISYSGEPGSVIARLTSVDTTGDFSFDVPIKDPLAGMLPGNGGYPWRLDEGYTTVVHLKNTLVKEVYALVQVRYEGGSYNPERIKIAPYQTVALDIKQLRDNQQEDMRGEVMPTDVESGQVEWHEDGAGSLIGRAEVVNIATGVASSFSCEPICCTPVYDSSWITPSALVGFVGGLLPGKQMEQRRDCQGVMWGPYDRTSDSTWSSSNTSVANVSGGMVSFLSPGSATVTARFQALISQMSPPVGSCNPMYAAVTNSGNVTAIQITDVVAEGAIKVSSVVGNQSMIHFVTPKGASGELVTLTATITPNDQTSANMITWDGATQDASNKLKATVSKGSANKKVVKIKAGGQVGKELRVWVVWSTITSTDAFPVSYEQTSALGIVSGGYTFTHTIQPGSIITDSNRPDLSGGKTTDPPGGSHWAGDPLSGGADKKWDGSRQIRVKWVQGPGQCCGSVAPDGIAYPSNDVEGNDDARTNDPENNDPYNNGGKLSGVDKPDLKALHGSGNEGDTIEQRLHFREFTRLEIEGAWYRISDYYPWRIHFKMRKSGGKWVNNGSNKALDNNGF